MKKLINFKNYEINEQNSYVLINFSKAIVIDPGFNVQKISNFLDLENLDLTDILITHFHADHIGDMFDLVKKYKAKIHISKKDFDCLLNPKFNKFHEKMKLDLNNFKDFSFNLFEKNINRLINDFNVNFIIVSGHTPGSTFFEIDESWLFVGDTLFIDKIGFHNDLLQNIDGPVKELLHLTCNDKDFFKSIDLIVNKYENKTIYPGHWEIGFKVKYVLSNPNHPYNLKNKI